VKTEFICLMALQSCRHLVVSCAHTGCVKPAADLQSAGRFFPTSDGRDHLKRFLPSSGGTLHLLGFVVNKSVAAGGIYEIHIAPVFFLTFVGHCIGDLPSFLVLFLCHILLESTLWLTVFACSIATLQFF